MPYSVVVGYHHFGGRCCFHFHPEDAGGSPLKHYMASQPRRPQLESSPLWKPQILQHTKH